MFKSGRKKNTFGGIAPGAYIEGVWNVLYVSSIGEDILGLKAKRHDMSLDDFINYAKAVYNYNQSHTANKLTFFWMLRDGSNRIFAQLAMSELGKDSTVNSEEGFAILSKIYMELEKLVPYKPLEQNVNAPTDNALFENKIFFCYSPSWISLLWQKGNSEGEKKMHPCELPSMGNKIATSYSGFYNAVFVVPKNAKNKDAAIKLMKFICSEETAEKWVKYSKCPTGLKHKVVYSDFSQNEINQFSQHITKKYNDELLEVNLAKTFFRTDKKIDFLVKPVMNGEISAADALKNVKSQLKK